MTSYGYNNNGLVGSWHFSEGTGNRTSDSSGYGNDGTMYGNMNTTLDGNLSSGWVSAGKFGNALKFDGVDDYVNTPQTSVLNLGALSNYAVGFWFKANATTANTRLVTLTDGGEVPSVNTGGIYFAAGNKVTFGYFGSWGIDSSNAVSTGIWYYVLLNRNGTHTVPYILDFAT